VSEPGRLSGEFELIAHYFVPLAKGYPDAFGLMRGMPLLHAHFDRCAIPSVITLSIQMDSWPP